MGEQQTTYESVCVSSSHVFICQLIFTRPPPSAGESPRLRLALTQLAAKLMTNCSVAMSCAGGRRTPTTTNIVDTLDYLVSALGDTDDCVVSEATRALMGDVVREKTEREVRGRMRAAIGALDGEELASKCKGGSVAP